MRKRECLCRSTEGCHTEKLTNTTLGRIDHKKQKVHRRVLAAIVSQPFNAFAGRL